MCVSSPPTLVPHYLMWTSLLISSVDTQYVDVSKYSEKPVHVLKSLFRYWFDKALWHKPTILILDNLETVLSAEVEVYILSCLQEIRQNK